MFTRKTSTPDEGYEKRIPAMFSAVSDLYAAYWHDFFHFALFEDEDESWESAFERTHRQYMDDLETRRAERILVLACGRGGLAHYIAEQAPQATVLGIDLSEAQLRHARKRRQSNLRFECRDIMKVDALGETFDAAVFLDAACYLPDTTLALKKIGRVLRPGARLLLVDWCKQEGLSRLQEELLLDPFKKYWAIPNLETPGAYSRSFKESGFVVLRHKDLNGQTRRNWDFAYERALQALQELPERRLPELIWTGMKLGSRGIRLIKEQFPSALYVKAGFDAGFLRYTYFLVEKKE